MSGASIPKFATLALGLLLGGCSAHHPSPPPPEPFRPGISLSVSEAGLENGAVADRFDLRQVRDLYVRVKVADMPYLAKRALTFINPVGEVFFEEVAAFSVDPTMNVMDETGSGVDTAVTTAKRIPKGWALDRPVPIGGTIFERVPIPDGDWQIQAVVTGTSEMLTTTLHAMRME
jgi:hypothetical protein